MQRRWSTVLKRSPGRAKLLHMHELVEDQQPRCLEPTVLDSMAALDTLPDDVLLLIVAACSEGRLASPELDAVSGLGSLCKDVLQQLQRLRPIVCVQIRSVQIVQRLSHTTRSPWRTVLAYTGELTAAVVEEAVRGRVLSINMRRATLAPEIAECIVPGLLGAGCSLLDLKLERAQLNGTWTAVFGEAAVCSNVLRELQMDACGLVGEMPMLRLPALQSLFMYRNQLSGSLEPLIGCKALCELDLSHNELEGELERYR